MQFKLCSLSFQEYEEHFKVNPTLDILLSLYSASVRAMVLIYWTTLTSWAE